MTSRDNIQPTIGERAGLDANAGHDSGGTVREIPGVLRHGPWEGRLARCSCGKTTPSNPDLPFFEDRGEGSASANKHCKHCGYFACAHDKEALSKMTQHPATVIERGLCRGFEPHGGYEFDKFYCGCFGWS